VGKGNPADIFQYIKYRNPVLAGRFHADISATVRQKPLGEFYKTAGKGGEATYLVCGNAFLVSRSNAGNDKLIVDIDSAADRMYDF
jgi:hypothetical protein